MTDARGGTRQGALRTGATGLAALFLAGSSIAIRPAGAQIPAGVWLAGDLHVHTIWSKDVCETPTMKNTRDASKPNEPCEEPWTWGFSPGQQLAIAADRGLDFLALTDHNTNRHLSDGEVTGYIGPLVVIPGTEFTLSGGEGHANLLNWSGGKPPDPTPGDGYTPADIVTIVDQVHAAGGLFSINHPLNPAWGLGFPDADSIEVWNFPWASMVLPFIGSENTRAIAWWEQNFLAAGKRPAAVGGSDNHWRSTSAIQGVGQPTTWVFATDKSLSAILEAIRAGRTSVSAEPPAHGGARLFLEGDADGDGVFDRMIGDSMPAGPRSYRVRALNAAGMRARVVGPEGIVAFEGPVAGPDATLSFSATTEPGKWLRAELFVTDGSSERASACRTLGVDGVMDTLNQTITDAATLVIPAASEVRPLNTGPCVVAQMEAITSPIWAV